MTDFISRLYDSEPGAVDCWVTVPAVTAPTGFGVGQRVDWGGVGSVIVEQFSVIREIILGENRGSAIPINNSVMSHIVAGCEIGLVLYSLLLQKAERDRSITTTLANIHKTFISDEEEQVQTQWSTLLPVTTPKARPYSHIPFTHTSSAL